MKKISGILGLIVLSAGLIFVLISPASAGLLELNGRVSLYNPPEAGAGTTLLYGLGANLNFSPNLTASLGIEYTTYSTSSHNYSLMPVTLDLIYHLTSGAFIDPYLGAGLGFYKKTIDLSSKTSTGGQFRAGVDMNILFFDAGLEVRYLVPDFSDLGQATMSYGVSFAGSFWSSF